MEFFQYKNTLLPEKGRILASEPYLPDPNFERTIIILTEHNDDGSVGFILNKPSETEVSEVMDSIQNFQSKVCIGGPVQQDTLHFLHRIPDLADAILVSEGIYWGGNFEQLMLRIETNQIDPIDIKFFLGYSGWSPGQLEEEIKADSWILSDRVSQELIFETPPETMWKKSLQQLGGRFSVYSNYPIDPSMN
ncbi:MAG: YqgE/AlgH family protein [Cytophagales bacterium]|nr:YqgE/AlgH family protein [Cytophagales bacterium]MCA6367446.1 YqgE/AlgH family protein [Cytophagales bacterium]MCA6372573.1 YqgE/AlgH family protein [Cytophagales bacterium]MCA6377270.1 YqgE/AlgH family protein [Cytophagales bacterium]MCA6383889.1 YqgE/AlgH family protein [Cytophagales bacterium]